MRLKTYCAATMADCLVLVKKDLGKDAVILHTRVHKAGGFLGFGAKERVEVTASNEVPTASRLSGVRGRGKDAGSQGGQGVKKEVGAGVGAGVGGFDAAANGRFLAKTYGPSVNAAAVVSQAEAHLQSIRTGAGQGVRSRSGAGDNVEISVTGQQAGATGGVGIGAREGEGGKGRAAGRSDLNRSDVAVGQSGATAAMMAELTAIKTMIGQVLMHGSVGAEVGGGIGSGGSSQSCVARLFSRLLEVGFERSDAEVVVRAVSTTLSQEELASSQVVASAARRAIASLLPRCDATLPRAVKGSGGGASVIALVGPTGVGKTTTIAKLAATYKLRQNLRVGLITADTYRIAAVEQLRTYASIINLPLKVAIDGADVTCAIGELTACGCEVILLDTAGRSPSDAPKLDELAELLEAAKPSQTHLMISAVASVSASMRTIEKFGQLSPSHVLISKLDEACELGGLGSILSAVKSAMPKVQMSFVTVGQEVPDDIEIAQGDRLARRMLGEFVESPASGVAAGTAQEHEMPEVAA